MSVQSEPGVKTAVAEVADTLIVGKRWLAAGMAAGIDAEVLSRWLRLPTDGERIASDAVRFDFDGPILDSSAQICSGGDTSGFVTPKMLREFLAENAGEDIEININSPGGSVFAANAMLADLARHDGKVSVVVVGACFSAAADFLTLKGVKRTAMPGAMFMIHNASTFAYGDANAMRAVAERLSKMNQTCVSAFARSTKLSADRLADMMDAETWFTETEALEAGLVDEIYDPGDSDADEKEDVGEDESDGSDEGAEAIRRGNAVVNRRLIALL